jgi:predicted kinase
VLARKSLDTDLEALLTAGTPVVPDYSFWRRTDRHRYKAMIEGHGRPWKLFVLRIHPDVLRSRLAARSRRFDSDAAFPITDDLLYTYLRDFEWPHDEGQIEICDRSPPVGPPPGRPVLGHDGRYG